MLFSTMVEQEDLLGLALAAEVNVQVETISWSGPKHVKEREPRRPR